MPLVPITLPSGMYKNGTPYDGKSRWVDGNLVRWHDGALRPIGGWEVFVDELDAQVKVQPTALPLDEVVRDGISWRSNTNSRAVMFFSNKRCFYITSAGTVLDVTPAGYVGGSSEPELNTGYGAGAYGFATYGTPRQSTAVSPTPVYRVSSSTWGEDLLFCGDYSDNLLYSYKIGDAAGLVVPNAPTDINGVVVTDERIVMTIGSVPEPRLVQWSERENREDWTPTQANYAGFYNLTGKGQLVSIDRVLNTTLILSETDAHVARYIGAPFVYGFDRVGEDCGPLHRGAVAVTANFAIWFGRRSVFVFDGTVKQIPCDVMDFLQTDFNFDMVSKLTSYALPNFSEVWWFYQSVNSTEVDSYVAFDYLEGHWSTGRLARTAVVYNEVTQYPLYVTFDGAIYNHEIDSILVEGAYAETGPLELGQGDKNMAVRYLFPDSQTTDDVQYTLYGRAMPTAIEYVYGPYTYNNPISTRAMGREIRMRVDGLTNRWEVGAKTRFDLAPVGTGMR